MKNIFFLIGALLLLSFSPPDDKHCGKYKGRNIYKGKEGGCFYLKGKAHKKVYIKKEHCKC